MRLRDSLGVAFFFCDMDGGRQRDHAILVGTADAEVYARPVSLSPGMMVGSNVRLVRMLGEGGMGSVWVADHLTLRTQVAVKFMTRSLAEQSDAVARFTREAVAAAAIKSPHVVRTLDHGATADGIPYIVMELLEGEDLGRRLGRVGHVSAVETASVVTQVCKALSGAHALGIVHRDIKPENIFLTTIDGELFVKVLDFGIAKQTHATAPAVTSTGASFGTPYYMSPEQVVSAKAADSRSDLWSLGVVAYHCLTGMHPFDGETLGALWIAIDHAAFRPATEVNPLLPPAIDVWLARALCRDAAGRFGSAKEMAEALNAAVHAAHGVSGAIRQPAALQPNAVALPGAGAAALAGGSTHALASGASSSGAAATALERQAVPAATLGGASVSAPVARRKGKAGMVAGLSIAALVAVAGIGLVLLFQAPAREEEPVPSDIAPSTAVALPAAAPTPSPVTTPATNAAAGTSGEPAVASTASAASAAAQAKPPPPRPASRGTGAPVVNRPHKPIDHGF